MSDATTLNALVHGKQIAVSFRQLSSLLNIPARRAQKLLLEFAASDPGLTCLWCITKPHPKTGVVRTSLTTAPPPNTAKQIWAVGPPSAATAPSQQAMWFADDAARDRDFVTQPSHIRNELRDGRWNRIQSESNSWDTKLDPRLGCSQHLAAVSHASSSARVGSSSLLASVRAKTKGKKASATGFMTNTVKSGPGRCASLFASKPLGADMMKRMRELSAKDRKKSKEAAHMPYPKSEHRATKVEAKVPMAEKRSPEAKRKRKQQISENKSRKVMEDESDADDPSSPRNAEVEDDEDRECMREFEREAAEKEKADAERADLERELMDLKRDDPDDEPQSPELKELNADYSANHEKLTAVVTPEEHESFSDGGKRSFWRTFGDSPEGTKRIRREIEETVEENGYFVTRRVVKIFDENGKEVRDVQAGEQTRRTNQTSGKEQPNQRNVIPLQPKNLQSTKERVLSTGLKKDNTGDPRRPISKLGHAAKKTPKKKVKGSIMSYFGRKS